ncbi:Fungal pheromone STE3G-protein-coupled receptor [Mycena chlorophos]|uniref:Fungal pheromone STE3G-protein-coupled receptor n=1 Tax=Mycena chlorophos TaxID=658473 RepID=A0A8H6WI82_MYCCL|nr:Fungal pheromone STE3G-protein-coupled receptor [Mycena chlorophos]
MAGTLALLPFAALFLLLLTVPHHWRMRPHSFATLSIIAWLGMHNVIQGVDAVIWANDAASKGLAANVCDENNARSGVSARNENGKRRKRDWAIDIFLCWGMPVIVMGLHIIVQGHRFDILQPFGCQATIYNCWQSLVLINLTVFLSGLLSPVYSACTLYALHRRHRAVRLRIQYNSSVGAERHTNGRRQARPAMSFATFVRLLIVTVLVGTLMSAFVAYAAYVGLDPDQGGLLPWDNWADVHYGFGAIYSFNVAQYHGQELAELWLFWLLWPLGSITFFLFFGIGKDVWSEWRERWQLLAARFERRAGRGQRRTKVRGESIVSELSVDTLGDPEKGEIDDDEKAASEDGGEDRPAPQSTPPPPPVQILVTVAVEPPVTLCVRVESENKENKRFELAVATVAEGVKNSLPPLMSAWSPLREMRPLPVRQALALVLGVVLLLVPTIWTLHGNLSTLGNILLNLNVAWFLLTAYLPGRFSEDDQKRATAHFMQAAGAMGSCNVSMLLLGTSSLPRVTVGVGLSIVFCDLCAFALAFSVRNMEHIEAAWGHIYAKVCPVYLEVPRRHRIAGYRTACRGSRSSLTVARIRTSAYLLIMNPMLSIFRNGIEDA